jgi:hypothetical protein
MNKTTITYKERNSFRTSFNALEFIGFFTIYYK